MCSSYITSITISQPNHSYIYMTFFSADNYFSIHAMLSANVVYICIFTLFKFCAFRLLFLFLVFASTCLYVKFTRPFFFLFIWETLYYIICQMFEQFIQCYTNKHVDVNKPASLYTFSNYENGVESFSKITYLLSRNRPSQLLRHLLLPEFALPFTFIFFLFLGGYLVFKGQIWLSFYLDPMKFSRG